MVILQIKVCPAAKELLTPRLITHFKHAQPIQSISDLLHFICCTITINTWLGLVLNSNTLFGLYFVGKVKSIKLKYEYIV